ncbi:hypothetical protein ITP53_15090 [Nonomuraea sp. K274]|uniref:Uncharacterized protein n=1 Tax=Nonomuraea cypriaca TaxID=1187855 RepID=A0A931AAH8_9ACTN|nr:hypothetical protein [Nonomuraea cypriaca]
MLGPGVVGCGDARRPEAADTPAATATGSASSPAAGPTTAPPPSSATPDPAATPGSREALVAGRYQPLWPFATQAEAAAWQRAHRENGDDAWHLDPGRTALAFTRDHLGFTEIDRAVKTVRDGRHARVHVGFHGQEGTLVAAVVHLVRYGAGTDAPWEVVGTDDTSFSLTKPGYGKAVAGSPLTVGGRLSGVDENIKIQVRRPGAAAPLGERCCVPGGGEDSPWSAEVTFAAPADTTLTIVASTGGHVADVERFTVTGVNTGS